MVKIKGTLNCLIFLTLSCSIFSGSWLGSEAEMIPSDSAYAAERPTVCCFVLLLVVW